jgi:hypothetical protein
VKVLVVKTLLTNALNSHGVFTPGPKNDFEGSGGTAPTGGLSSPKSGKRGRGASGVLGDGGFGAGLFGKPRIGFEGMLSDGFAVGCTPPTAGTFKETTGLPAMTGTFVIHVAE